MPVDLDPTAPALVRAFQRRDRAALEKLWTTVFADEPPWNAPALMIDAKLTVQPELLLVAYVDAELIGAIMAGFDGVRGWIHHLAVAPEWRRRGVAKQLVRSAEAGLLRRGCAKVNLQLRASNAAVVAFYESLGYRVEERVSMGRRLEASSTPGTWPLPGDGTERTLSELSSIETRFATTTVGDHRVLVLHHAGIYRIGCEGNPDSALMRAMGRAGVEAFQPDAVLLDLRELEYVWGDMLDQVFEPGGAELPSAVVVGPRCREAIGTLLFGEGDPRDPTEDDAFFDEVQPALDFLRMRLEHDGKTDLHRAACAGDYEAVERLLQAGSAVNARDRSRQTALHEASHPAVVRALVKAGAEVDARNDFGATALYLTEKPDVAGELLAAGADPDARTSLGYSPLYRAGVSKAKLLIAAGADVQVRSRTTLLHCVKDLDVAKVLVEAGAPVDVVDEAGESCVDRARRSMEQFEAQGDAETSARYRAIYEYLRDAK